MNGFRCPNGRPALLVSVRSADEARIALAGGADVIDVKEPSRGSLGAADADVVATVVATVGGQVPVSVAMGELVALGLDPVDLCGVAFAKVGLAECRRLADWPARWRATIKSWPASVQPVAVVYADWRRANAPPPNVVLAVAATIRCPALLVDTWDKSAGTLFDLWSPEDVASFCRRVREAGMAAVLAGSLAGHEVVRAVECGADLVAVRGAVCDGQRTGSISATRVRAVRESVNRLSPAGTAKLHR
jgi:uncharacterized protein (UPF0264 family)